ncbi:MAG: toll/interleukin-1 receptor domain-containing protein, partial [Pseudomonadota bacterium]
MAQVFISYPSNDDGHLNSIINAASAACRHVSVWTAQGLEGGENYWDIIRGEIARRDVVVMLITRAALEGDGVKTELDIARRAGKPIIPVIKTSDVALEELRGTAFEGLLL